MNRLKTIAILCLMGIMPCWAQRGKIEYTKKDSTLVVKLLNDAKTGRGTENRVFYFGKKFLGLPYVAHTLELGDTEHLIVNLHELDCTTFVETVVALSMCDQQDKRTFADYCQNLEKVRFRGGKMGDYTSRLHYFTWWAEDNEKLGIVKDISIEDAPFLGVQTVHINYMTAHPSSYKQLKNHPDFVPIIKKYEQATEGKQFRYILKKDLSWNAGTPLSMVKDGDIVAMLTDSDGLDTRHIGIAFWQGGKLHLLHASSLYKKVVMSKETFYEYEMKQPKHTGIRVFRFND
ncbi:MAG: DUF1460 domain-containing protein [Bacteroidaceae bacterium]|nr:DUF1460 domain-containing protein [Bacteroidaceae bacterium]